MRGSSKERMALPAECPGFSAEKMTIFASALRKRQSCQEPTLEIPISQACTYGQFLSPIYSRWCKSINETPCTHRKQWEFVYILQVLSYHGFLKPGFRGLGFGVGQEPLPAYFASNGINVTATDMAAEDTVEAGWAATGQHADSLNALNTRGICDPELFLKRVHFETVDMNRIPEHLRGFDFTWSSCCFEHLGSIKAGLDFVRNSLETLRPGGVAVHTTEFNCSSNWHTVEKKHLVLFRRKDLEGLIKDLRSCGHEVTATFHLGYTELDKHVDMPPYRNDKHLKLKISEYTATSFGLTVVKKR
jgi:SAM-dependent methyltransferase